MGMRNEKCPRQRTATIRREQTGKNATNVFENSNNLNELGFKHLVDIEGVTGFDRCRGHHPVIGIELCSGFSRKCRQNGSFSNLSASRSLRGGAAVFRLEAKGKRASTTQNGPGKKTDVF
jgi:hypothetical protein